MNNYLYLVFLLLLIYTILELMRFRSFLLWNYRLHLKTIFLFSGFLVLIKVLQYNLFSFNNLYLYISIIMLTFLSIMHIMMIVLKSPLDYMIRKNKTGNNFCLFVSPKLLRVYDGIIPIIFSIGSIIFLYFAFS